MRLAVCTLSAVLLSGCSWLGGVGNVFNGGGQGHYAKSSQYGYGGAHHGQHQYRAQQDPCQVFSPQAPIPQGCHPSQVTLGTGGGFPQQPNFGGGQYASQGYGSHAGVAHQQAAHYQPRKSKLRKPRFRGSMSLGVEKSNAGDLLDFESAGASPASLYDSITGTGYNPQDYNEGSSIGGQASGAVTTTTFTANERDASNIFADGGIERINAPNISFDDVYSTPARFAFGGEYIMSPNTTLFANAGYSVSEGKAGNLASVDATLYRRVSEQAYVEDPANPGTYIADGSPSVITNFIPNRQIAQFGYDFTDMRRIDLEAGARRYFNPLSSAGFKTVTPFVGASVGASHYNAVSYNVTQQQAFMERAFNAETTTDYYDVSAIPNERVDLYDSQWVPSGQLNAGMEWQVTPKTALAFETGVRIEGARKYSNGERGDKNIAIPMTIRGSYNF